MSLPVHNTTNLRLEVETAPAGLPNIFRDPDASEGTWALGGWSMGTSSETALTSDGTKYTMSNPSAAATVTATSTQYLGLAAGSYVRARFTVTAVTASHALTTEFVWYNASRTYIGATTPTLSGASGGVGVTYTQAVAQAPAGTAYVILRLFLKNGASNAAAAASVSFNQVMLTWAATSAAVAGSFAFQPHITWANILGVTHSINIDRGALDVGTLAAIVQDATLDPAVTDTLATGKNVRVQALVAGVWESLFEGVVDDAEVTYRRDPKNPGGVLTTIALTATDNIAVLANTPQPRSFGLISQLPWITELWAQVPWKVNGGISHVRNPTNLMPVAYTDDASLLDQIAITRDSVSGYAWVDRRNVLVVYDKTSLPTTTAVTFSDVTSGLSTREEYSDIAAGYNKVDLINQLTITWLRLTGGPGTVPTEEIAYGPYLDQASVTRNGAHSKAFTLVGATESAPAIAAFAAAIIAANKSPVRKVTALTMPVRDTRSMMHATQLDLYDKVGVVFGALINTAYRITSIKHTIETDRWKVDYGFSVDGAVAIPR